MHTLHHQLSGDDVAIGEILIALKRDPVVHQATTPMAKISTASYRTKVDLSVQTPAANDATVTFDGVQYSTVSPVASVLYSAPTQSPTERTKRYGPVIQLEDLRKCFNMPIAAVARKFGICATLLKKICRRHGIQRWPHRQIRSLQKSIDMLRESLVVAKGSNKEYIAKKIAAFEHTLECIMQDPNTAAKGISTGRLASPASDDMAKRAKQRAKETSLLESSVAALKVASDEDDEEEEDHDMSDDSIEATAPWCPPTMTADDRKLQGMSLASILC